MSTGRGRTFNPLRLLLSPSHRHFCTTHVDHLPLVIDVLDLPTPDGRAWPPMMRPSSDHPQHSASALHNMVVVVSGL
ncbi:uncharacterized protein THITE_2084134 [Thermothielavioides terrestris NRRL 8126]|uniref:Uncharacterized protein n=1 Tax=Thermothielavioides terrestris (strain ATCC 38088 / NRRL 8126) TaxID=578455 RepID=G2QSD9_THETT|nr:uncharacterized protein THITE_2084134 [Thermothielavioides terrestris NRRL 8126]AEO62620.1 hypothetical protein THITE_2084134 [Thermothielavioides terrestris NRRL 8126]